MQSIYLLIGRFDRNFGQRQAFVTGMDRLMPYDCSYFLITDFDFPTRLIARSGWHPMMVRAPASGGTVS